MSSKTARQPINPDALIINQPQAALLLGMSLSTFRKLRKQPGFHIPEAITSTESRPTFRRCDIEQFAAQIKKPA
jgi:hypothetical protein